MSLRKFSHMTFVLGTSVALAACLPKADPSAESTKRQSALSNAIENGLTRAEKFAAAALQQRQQEATEVRSQRELDNARFKIEKDAETARITSENNAKNQLAEDANKLEVEKVRAEANKEISANQANAQKYQSDRQYSTMNKIIEVAPDALNFLNQSKRAAAEMKTAEAQSEFLADQGEALKIQARARMREAEAEFYRVPEETRQKQIDAMRQVVADQTNQAGNLMGALKLEMTAMQMAGDEAVNNAVYLSNAGIVDPAIRGEAETMAARFREQYNNDKAGYTRRLGELTQASQGLRSAKAVGARASTIRPGAVDHHAAEKLGGAINLLDQNIDSAVSVLAFDLLAEREAFEASRLYCMGDGELAEGCTEEKSKELTQFVQGRTWDSNGSVKDRLDKELDKDELKAELGGLKADLLKAFSEKVDSTSSSAEATKKAYEAFLDAQLKDLPADVTNKFNGGKIKLREALKDSNWLKVANPTDLQKHLPQKVKVSAAADVKGATAFATGMRFQPGDKYPNPHAMMVYADRGDNSYEGAAADWGSLSGKTGTCSLIGAQKEC